MKFRAERDALLEAITTAGRAAATRGTALPALTGVRLEVAGDQLHLAGTDLDVTIQVQMQVAAGEAGVCVIPARLATDIVRGLDPGSSPRTMSVARRAGITQTPASPAATCIWTWMVTSRSVPARWS